MKILLTGATGFLGSNLLRALLAERYEVVIVKRSSSDIWRIADIIGQFKTYDVDSQELELPFREEGPFAAVIHTATCYGRKGETDGSIFAANVAFPVQLLEYSHKRAGVFINTDTSLPRSLNAYAMSKKQFAEWGEFAAVSGGVRFVNLITEHFYGPGDDVSKITTNLVRSCLAGAPSIPLTLGEQMRDFIYIDDAVSAFLAVLRAEISASNTVAVYEVGSGEAVAIRDVAKLILKLSGSTTRLDFGAVPYRINEVMTSCADTLHLRRLGWEPAVNLEEGLRRTIEYERSREINS